MPWTTPKSWDVNELLTAADLNTHLRDNLNALKEPPTASYALAATYSTTSSSFVNVDSTHLALTITTTGGDVLIGFAGAWQLSQSTYAGYLTVTMDGANLGGASGVVGSGAATLTPVSFVILATNVPAGAHTFRLQWRVESVTVYLNGQGQFWAREVS